MTVGISNLGQVQPAQLQALKQAAASELKVKDMPMDSVSFGNKVDEDKPKSKVGIVATVIGAAALIGAGIWALRKGKTKDAQEVAGKAADEVAETVENVVKKDKSKMEIVKDSNGQLSRTHYYKLGEDGKAVETTTYFYGKDGFLEKATVRNGHFGEPISKIKYSKFDDGQGNIIVKAHEQKVGSNEWTVTNVGTVKKPVAKTDIASKGDVKSAEDSAKAMQEAWAKSNTEPEQVTNV